MAAYFSHCGDVASVEMTGNRSMALVMYNSVAEATAALELSGKRLLDAVIKVALVDGPSEPHKEDIVSPDATSGLDDSSRNNSPLGGRSKFRVAARPAAPTSGAAGPLSMELVKLAQGLVKLQKDRQHL